MECCKDWWSFQGVWWYQKVNDMECFQHRAGEDNIGHTFWSQIFSGQASLQRTVYVESLSNVLGVTLN